MRPTMSQLCGLCIALALCSCAGSGSSGLRSQAGSPSAQPYSVTGQPALPLAGLPAPAELLAGLHSGPSSTSYSPQDLFREAEAHEPLLPKQNVLADVDGALFSPDFPAGGGQFSGLAYAIYRFAPGDFSGNREFFLNWRGSDPANGTLYLGLADWEANRWQLRAIAPDSSGQLPDLSPFIDESGQLLAALILSGSEACELDWLRLGSLPPAVQFSVDRQTGLTPLTVSFSAAGSSDPDGSIEEYRWDPEGDGSFQISSGADPVLQYAFESGGAFNAAVRVMDDDGVYGTAQATITAHDSLALFYGANISSEHASEVLPQPDGSMLLVGTSRTETAGSEQGVFARINVDQQGGFARTWGGNERDTLQAAVMGPDGNVYVCGTTESYGAGGSDGLLQKWSPEGELLLSRTFGILDGDENFRSIVVTADAIYVCGSQLFTTTSRYFGMLLRFDLDGNLVWNSNFISPHHCLLMDLAYRSSAQINSEALLAVGIYYLTPGETDGFYLKVDEQNGSFEQGSIWDGGGGICQFNSISLSGAINPVAYVTGGMQNKMMLGIANGAMKLYVGTDSTNMTGMSLQGRRGLLLLSRLIFPGDEFIEQPVVFSFGSDLSIQSCLQVPTSSFNPSSLGSYDANNFVFCGSGHAGVSIEDYSLVEQPTSGTWSDVFPAVTSPSLVTADTSLSTGQPSYSYEGSFDDMTVFLGKL